PPFLFFLSSDSFPRALSTLSLHDALPICVHRVLSIHWHLVQCATAGDAYRLTRAPFGSTPWHDGRQRDIVQVCLVSRRASDPGSDRKSTRLNSSHQIISYAVFCLKKKNTK